MFLLSTIAILTTIGLALIRAINGPSTYDRILALNMVGTKTTILIVAIGFLTNRPDFVDIAMVYALINFIGVIAMLKYTRYGQFANSLDPNKTESENN
ncbi:MAG: pH regulation protein F [Rhodospirillaceae bacterium]|nr:pH regulation protein F [Rhodospirillaceae bacterium]|tara:strand:+ start:160 stop:453 length:294 start_codon:yes stop_codon:yes gene_type:complete